MSSEKEPEEVHISMSTPQGLVSVRVCLQTGVTYPDVPLVHVWRSLRAAHRACVQRSCLLSMAIDAAEERMERERI